MNNKNSYVYTYKAVQSKERYRNHFELASNNILNNCAMSYYDPLCNTSRDSWYQFGFDKYFNPNSLQALNYDISFGYHKLDSNMTFEQSDMKSCHLNGVIETFTHTRSCQYTFEILCNITNRLLIFVIVFVFYRRKLLTHPHQRLNKFRTHAS